MGISRSRKPRMPTSNQKAYKVLPGANFDFTWPITKTFGVVIAGMSTNVFAEQHRSFTTSGQHRHRHQRQQRVHFQPLPVAT